MLMPRGQMTGGLLFGTPKDVPISWAWAALKQVQAKTKMGIRAKDFFTGCQ